MKILFPNGLRKALTLSYDDGIEADVKLVDILNQYGIKSTFNLNSGIQTKTHAFELDGHRIARLPKETVLTLYNGHEVAIHSLTHPPLGTLCKADIYQELHDDKLNLENWFNYPMLGIAFPFGNYSADVLDVMKDLNIKYGRTVESTGDFSFPTNFSLWHPTCHHNDPKLMTLADQFLNDNSQDLKLFYVWGHSYEFDMDNNWFTIEAFCSKLSHQETIWYATNGEIMTYLEALKSVVFKDGSIINNSPETMWVEYLENIYSVEGHATLQLQ